MYSRLGFANSISKYSKEVEQRDNLYININEETKKYLQGLKQKAEKIVNDRHLAAQAPHPDSHASEHAAEHPTEHAAEHPVSQPVEQSTEQPTEQKEH